MLVLALDTSTPAVVVGIIDTDQESPLAERFVINPRGHGELLTPLIQEIVAEAGLTMSRLDAVVCGTGPGPFTSLRVGMVTGASIADALGKPVYPVCSLDAIGVAAAEVDDLLVITDARRKELYWARYHRGVRVAGPAVGKPEDVRVPGVVLAGHVASLYAEPWELPDRGIEYPTTATLVAAAGDALLTGAEPGEMVPLYLRKPDAVEPGARKSVIQA
ncbi:tRNA (adenosine(37)-N6)-threonylcarbamoyltransferase complex dimerization subunit type 1 TsaB [Pseudonocardiaceae bacterium YIM PH 21723]|nr:tRNA (adenosine(37)-N6)-threonylcarbamoyltransferase complex dimerization subunit type 1 TsaB [Pseudonocardiaceae bacterium YIM PH 21723]